MIGWPLKRGSHLESNVVIRKLKDFADFDQLVRIQKVIWNHKDVDLTPVHQFCISSRMGAILFGAFVNNEIAGFVYSFPAILGGESCQHSHLLAVLPEFQGLGIGKKLKWAQRREALKQGISLITWTYDPLMAKNANLNLHTLGVQSRTYFENFYGSIPSLCLAPEIPTDRLLVEWRIREDRIEGRKTAKAGDRNKKTRGTSVLAALPKALERGKNRNGFFPEPAPPRLGLKSGEILVEIPPDIKSLRAQPDTITAWQEGLRRVMPAYFRRGYVAEDFLFGERCFYVLKKSS